MKPSEVLRDQMKVIKNYMPEALATIRDTMDACMKSPVADFVEMGRELATKEAVFMAMGGFKTFFDMLEMLVKITEAAERFEEDMRKNV